MLSLQTEKIFDKDERKAFFSRIIHRIFYDDWLVKVFALIITLALWFGVTGLRAPITTRLGNVPLKTRVSNELEITNSPTAEVDLVVTGDKHKIEQINAENLIVSFDLTDAQPGDRVVQLTPENVSVELPTGVRLEEIQPNKIAVKLEPVAERDIAVKPATEGSVADGFEIYNVLVSPPKARVRGAESLVRSLDSISTEPIDLTNRSTDFTVQQVPLSLNNSKVTLIDAVVDVIFKIGEKRIEKPFVIPVKTDKGNKTATVILYGARSILDNLAKEDIRVEVIKNQAGEDSVEVALPPDIQNKIEIRSKKIYGL